MGYLSAVNKCIGIFGISLLLLITSNKLQAQYSDDYTIADSTYKQYHSPHKATFYSAIVPGMGQAYNKKYWKIPIIYAGFGGLIYYVNYNNYVYNKYKDAYNIRLRIDAGDSTLEDPFPDFQTDNILGQKEEWRRYRDLCIIGIGLLYIIQIIDADVDAHLFDYDISEDLSMRVEPILIDSRTVIYNSNSNNATIGLRCSIKF